MSASRGLNVMEWSQLHFTLQWVYRGKVPDAGRGHFQGTCGGAAWHLLRGEGRVEHERGEVRAGKGDWLFPNMGPHDRDFSRNAEILSLRYYIEWPDGQPLFRHPRAIVLSGAGHPDLGRTARALEQVVYRSGRQTYSGIDFMHERLSFSGYLEVEGALLKWSKALADALVAEGIKPGLERFEDKRVARALRVLDGWPLHRAFSLRQLVQETGISRAQLDRLFTAQLGQTAHQYFDKRRLRHAERSLLLPDHRIKEVAFDVGFRHVSSFSTWFKQNTGVNPNERKETATSGPTHNGPPRSRTRAKKGTGLLTCRQTLEKTS